MGTSHGAGAGRADFRGGRICASMIGLLHGIPASPPVCGCARLAQQKFLKSMSWHCALADSPPCLRSQRCATGPLACCCFACLYVTARRARIANLSHILTGSSICCVFVPRALGKSVSLVRGVRLEPEAPNRAWPTL